MLADGGMSDVWTTQAASCRRKFGAYAGDICLTVGDIHTEKQALCERQVLWGTATVEVGWFVVGCVLSLNDQWRVMESVSSFRKQASVIKEWSRRITDDSRQLSRSDAGESVVPIIKSVINDHTVFNGGTPLYCFLNGGTVSNCFALCEE